MVITAQLFLNELDLLELKFEELEGVVDLHVVFESPTTFTGRPKPLLFRDNASRFSKWPVKHVVFELPAAVSSPWDREAAAYKNIRRVVDEIDPDVTMWVDTDELPRADTVERFKAMNVDSASLDLDYILYFFDRIDNVANHGGPSGRWRHAAISRGKARPGRRQGGLPVVENSGWHFEFFGSKSTLLEKAVSTSHAVEPSAKSFMTAVEAGGQPGIERTTPYPIDRLPRVVQANMERFRSYFYE